MNVRLLIVLCVLGSLGSLGAPVATASAAPAAAPQTGAETAANAELEATLAKLADPNPTTRLAAVDAIAATSPDAFSALEARLLRTPEAGPGPMWLVLDKVKKQGPSENAAPDETVLARAVVTAGNTAGHRALAFLLAGIRASERQAGVVGARVLVRIAVDHKGLLKPHATAALRRMGDHAVAALVEVRRDNDKELRTFANKTLDAMGKFLPSDAVQVHDPQALADVLVAFGKTKDPDAMRAIVPYLNADRAPVREAARTAIAQYGNDAKPVLDEAFTQFTGEKPGADWPAKKTLDALVLAYDKVRLAEAFKLLDEGIAHRDAGRLEEAVASFDALLARAPQFERKAELASSYHELGRKKEPSDRPAARVLYAKAARLAVGTQLAGAIEADVAVLDTQELLDRGVADTSLLQRALAVDPSHQRARDMLQRIENDTRTKDDRFRRMALAAFVGVVVTVLSILFIGKREERRPPTPRRPIRV